MTNVDPQLAKEEAPDQEEIEKQSQNKFTKFIKGTGSIFKKGIKVGKRWIGTGITKTGKFIVSHTSWNKDVRLSDNTKKNIKGTK